MESEHIHHAKRVCCSFLFFNSHLTFLFFFFLLPLPFFLCSSPHNYFLGLLLSVLPLPHLRKRRNFLFSSHQQHTRIRLPPKEHTAQLSIAQIEGQVWFLPIAKARGCSISRIKLSILSWMFVIYSTIFIIWMNDENWGKLYMALQI